MQQWRDTTNKRLRWRTDNEEDKQMPMTEREVYYLALNNFGREEH